MENENKITPKPHLKLRKIGRKHMIVETVDGCVNLTNVYTLNETAAWLWESISKEDNRTLEELAESLCKEYRVEYDRVLDDVKHQLEEWERMGLLVRPNGND